MYNHKINNKYILQRLIFLCMRKQIVTHTNFEKKTVIDVKAIKI